jgi:hypothetical protein
MEDAALQRYVDKCRSVFGDGVAESGIHHRDLLERLRKWPEWKEIAAPQIEFFFEIYRWLRICSEKFLPTGSPSAAGISFAGCWMHVS